MLSASKTFVPSMALRAWIGEIRVMTEPPASVRTFTRLPSGESSVVFCVGAHETKLVAVGPTMYASYKRVDAVPLYARFAFKPGAVRELFGVPTHELVGRMVSIDELWTKYDLRETLGSLLEEYGRSTASADGVDVFFARVVRTLETALEARLPKSSTPDAHARLARAALAVLAEPDAPSLPALAARLGVSERHLRQVCHDDVGLSPKRIVRIERIRRATRLAGLAARRERRGGWAGVAVDAGFYDQAHLNAEFRALLGVSPRRFLAGELPVRNVCVDRADGVACPPV